jgi:hypothetical protein
MAWIRTLLIPAMALALTAHPVCATDIITTFDVTATLANSTPPCNSPCTLGGTVTIDVTTGNAVSAAITAPGTSTGPFDLNLSTTPLPGPPNATTINVFDSQNHGLGIALPVASLINYAGGPICAPSCFFSGGESFSGIFGDFHTLYLVTSGSLSPVPGPIAGAGLPGLIAACGGFLGWWRRRKIV